jgi:ribonucleoside-diphosphate reductase subunit M2
MSETHDQKNAQGSESVTHVTHNIVDSSQPSLSKKGSLSDKKSDKFITTRDKMGQGKQLFLDLFKGQVETIVSKTIKNNDKMSDKMKSDLEKIHLSRFESVWQTFSKNLFDIEKLSCITDKNDPDYEEITDPNNFRLTTKPLNPKYQVFWDLYMKQFNSIWRASEIDYTYDKNDFENTLDDNEREFVKMILSFFAASDGIVNMNLRERFLNEIQITEAQYAYSFQLMMENVHAEVYSDMLINIVKNNDEREKLFNGFKTVKSIKSMTDWATKWIDDKNATIGKRVVAFAIVEGIFFSGAFAAIYWLKKNRNRGKHFMNGLIKSNNFIARDEGLHTNFACVLYKFVQNKVSKEEIKIMFDEAVELTTQFSQDAIRCDLIGMNPELMQEYNKYVSDRLLVYLGYEKIYNATNPFDFMETIGFLNKDNFFEVRPDAYQSATNESNTSTWTPTIDKAFESSDDDEGSDEDCEFY